VKKKFITNLLFLLGLNIPIKLFWIFGIDRTVQIVTGAQQYGFYFSLFNFSLILNILLDLGLTNYNNRNIAQNSHMLGKFFPNIIMLKVLLGGVYFLVSFVIGALIGYGAKEFWLLFVLLFNQFLLSFILYFRSNLSGLHLFKYDSMISVIDRLIVILLCGSLLIGNLDGFSITIEVFAYIQTIAYLLTFITSFILVYRNIPKNVYKFTLKIDIPFFAVVLRQSFPFALLILLMAFYNRVDSVMLERLLPDGVEQAGIYAQSFRILDALSMFAYLFAGILMPIFSKMIKEKKDITQMVRFSFLLMFVPSIILSASLSVYAKEIMGLLYSEHQEITSAVFRIIVLSFVPISFTYIFGSLLTANGSLMSLNKMAVVGMCLNVILNLILIPVYKALGSAVAGLITQSITALLQVIIALMVFKIKIRFFDLLKSVLFILLFMVLACLMHSLPMQWSVSFVLTLIGGLIISIIFRQFKPLVILKIIRSEEQ